ncbi:MAG: hypothetical protein Q9163_002143 [Psora crenata]
MFTMSRLAQVLLHWLPSLLLLTPVTPVMPVMPVNTSALLAEKYERQANTSERSLSLWSHNSTHTNDWIPYRVNRSPTTLELHHISSPIPEIKVLLIFTHIAKRVKPVLAERGSEAIEKGHCKWELTEDRDKDIISLSITDFREVGKSLTYSRLFDVLVGIPHFFIAQRWYKELSFEVVVDGVGYVATGHLDYKRWLPSSSITVGTPVEASVASS